MGGRPTQIAMPTREWFWEHQNLTYARMAMRWGDVTEAQIKSCGRNMLFRRPLREVEGFAHGPCVRCFVQYERRAMSEAHHCTDCAKDVAEELANRPRTPQELRDEEHRALCRAEAHKRGIGAYA